MGRSDGRRRRRGRRSDSTGRADGGRDERGELAAVFDVKLPRSARRSLAATQLRRPPMDSLPVADAWRLGRDRPKASTIQVRTAQRLLLSGRAAPARGSLVARQEPLPLDGLSSRSARVPGQPQDRAQRPADLARRDPDDAVARAHHLAPVGAELRRVPPAPGAEEHDERLASAGAPDPDRPVPARADHAGRPEGSNAPTRPIRRGRGGSPERPPSSVPDAHRAVGAGADEAPPVGAVGDRVHGLPVPGERPLERAARRVPQPHRAVVGGAGELRPVGAERDVSHDRRWPLSRIRSPPSAPG